MYVWLTANQKCFTSVLETIQKRLRQSDVVNILFKKAYYLDPRYHGERLSKRELKEVRSHLLETLSSDPKFRKTEQLLLLKFLAFLKRTGLIAVL